MNMRQMILVGGIICLLAGCRTPTMKGTPFYAGEERKTVGAAVDDTGADNVLGAAHVGDNRGVSGHTA